MTVRSYLEGLGVYRGLARIIQEAFLIRLFGYFSILLKVEPSAAYRLG